MKNDTFLGIDKNSLSRVIDKDDFDKAWKVLENFKNNKIKNDYDFFNKLSLGNGSTLYNKYSYDKLSHSLEYTSLFDYFKHKKMFNLDTEEGMDLHVYRNKNQYNKAPKDLKTMNEFVKAGYFIFEGFSPCHNLKAGSNDEKSRRGTLSITASLVLSKKLYKPNEHSPLLNISYRGTPGTSFEGCQFIYNYMTGKFISDNINRGTWDYGKYATSAHFILDIYPWLRFGNGDNLETADMFIMSDAQEKLYMTREAIEKARAAKKKSSIFMNDKNIAQEFLNYNKWDNEIRQNKNLMLTGNTEKEFINTNLSKSKEEFIDDRYIKNCEKRYNNGLTSNIDLAYKDAWFDYVSFLTCVENREINKGMEQIVSFLTTDPVSFRDIINDNREKERYGEYLFKTAFESKQIDKKAGEIIKTKLPITITVYFTQTVTDNVKSVFNKLGADEAKNQAIYYVDSIVELFNKNIKKYNFEVGFSADFIDKNADFDHILLNIYQKRKVSETEATILSNKVLKLNADRFVDNNKDITHPDSEISNESLVLPCKPEYYSIEGFTPTTKAIFGFALISLVAGGIKFIYDKVNENKLKKFAIELANKFEKMLSVRYDEIYKVNKNIKTKILASDVKSITDYDKYGVYNIYEPSDFIKKEDFIKERVDAILLAAKTYNNYDDFIKAMNPTYYENVLVDGFMLKDVYSDPTLLRELTKFEYGDNSDNQNSEISLLQEMGDKIETKLLSIIDPIVKTEKEINLSWKVDKETVNWSKIGKEPMEDKLHFNISYTQCYNINYNSIKIDIEELIKKL